MAPNDRTQQEQIRKRRNNLLKRLDEFVRRYKMRIWMTMEMPSGRIYTYRSNPDEAAPTDEEIRERKPPSVQKTPADYAPSSIASITLPDPPLLTMNLNNRKYSHKRNCPVCAHKRKAPNDIRNS